MHFRGIFLCFILCQLTLLSFAQDVKLYPVQFSPLWSNYSLINPASTNIHDKIELNTTYRSLLGQFKGIEEFYVNAAINLSSHNDTLKRNKNIVGITFFNEKEGEIINKTRSFLTYAYHTPLTETWSLGAGLALGFGGYAYKGTATTASAADYKPDGNLGFWLYSDRTTIGLSVDQLFNTTVVPKFYTFQFGRYVNLHVKQKIQIGPYIYLQPHLQLRWLSKQHQDIDIGTSIVFRDLVTTGINYKLNKQASLMVGFKNVHLGKTKFNVAFNYNRNFYIDHFESIELSFNYYINP